MGNLRTSVAIVGYGPTGQILAMLLARRGHHVTVIERWPDLYPLPRAVHFDHEVGRILQAAGVAEDAYRITEAIDVYEWRNAKNELLLALDWTGPGLSGWPQSSMFSQPSLERVFDRNIKANPLIRVMQGWEAVSLTVGEGATLVVERGDTLGGAWLATGERTIIEANYVVGADGANSFVRRSLEIEVHDLGFMFQWLVVDLMPTEEREWKPETWQLCDPARPTTIVPAGPGRRRWEFMLLPGERPDELNCAEAAWKLLEPWDVRPENATLERHAVYKFRGQWAKRWRDGRVFLAGDSAHLMPPFAGQGMCSGLRDACALAWRLDLALRGQAGDAMLDSYGPERTGHVRAMIDYSIELGKVICITDPDLAAERDARMLAERAASNSASLPPLLPKLGAGLYLEDHSASGMLAPQGRVTSHGRSGLFDDVFGCRFALIIRNAAGLENLTSSLRAALEAVGGVVVVAEDIEDATGVYGSWLDSLRSVAALVRPDFYLFGTAADHAHIDWLVSKLLVMLSAKPEGTEDALRLAAEQASPESAYLEMRWR